MPSLLLMILQPQGQIRKRNSSKEIIMAGKDFQKWGPGIIFSIEVGGVK